MSEKHIDEALSIVNELKQFVDKLNSALINEIPKEMREANKQYRDLINLAGELNARLAKP